MKVTLEQHKLLCAGELPGLHGRMVPLAAAQARAITTEELEDPHSLQRLYEAQRNLAKTVSRTLPIETQLVGVLNSRLTVVQKEIVRLELAAEIGLPTLDPSFLAWKIRGGYPAFSIYSLDNPVSQICFTRERSTSSSSLSMQPSLPPILANFYLNPALRNTFEGECIAHHLSRIELSAMYAGAMPAEVRDLIHLYTDGEKAGCFEFIFIIAEAPKWSRKVAPIPVGDPLVVGIKQGLVWLIATYDLSPVEQVAKELCTSPVSATRGNGTVLHGTN